MADPLASEGRIYGPCGLNVITSPQGRLHVQRPARLLTASTEQEDATRSGE
jgi:hypothetical protein